MLETVEKTRRQAGLQNVIVHHTSLPALITLPCRLYQMLNKLLWGEIAMLLKHAIKAGDIFIP